MRMERNGRESVWMWSDYIKIWRSQVVIHNYEIKYYTHQYFVAVYAVELTCLGSA